MPLTQVNIQNIRSSGSSAGIYDGDYDGVPYIFDPNDSDPNIPGSGAGPMMAGGGGQPEQFGGQCVSALVKSVHLFNRRENCQTG